MRKIFIITLFVTVFLMANCSSPTGDDNGGNNNGNGQDNPVPTLNSITPTSKVNHMPTFTLTVKGANFLSSSKIVFDGTEKNTTFVSATELTCQVQTGDITLTSTAQYTDPYEVLSTNVPVKVRNPAPGGGDSGTKNFKINDKHTFNGPDKIADFDFPYMMTYTDICAKSPGYLYMAWIDYTSGAEGMYFAYSTDKGESWSTPDRILNGDSCFLVKIDTDSSGNICLIWCNNAGGNSGVYFRRSTDNGASWSSVKAIAKSSDSYGSCQLFVDSSDNINTIWTKDSYLYFSRSTDSGSNWSSPVQVYSKNYIRDPHYTVDKNGNIYVVFMRNTLGRNIVYFTRSTNHGSSWGGVAEMESNYKFSSNPDVAVNKAGDIYIVYKDTDPHQGYVWYVKSTDKGENWTAMKRISDQAGAHYDIDIAVDDAGNIFVVRASTKNTNSDWNIYYSDSFDSGNTWSATRNISETSGGSFMYPFISLDSEGNIYIVCTGNFSGDWEVSFISSQQ